MKSHTILAAIAAVIVLTACGGGGSGGGDTPGTPAEPPAPEATPVGQPIGTAVKATIGRAGGVLRSADGSVSVEVPAGALAADETLTLQEISHENHGAPGRAWRIGPQTLAPALPLTLRFRYAEADLQGTDASELRLARQDARRRWVLPTAAAPTIDKTTRTLTLATHSLGDWSRFARTTLTPSAATVRVGQSLALKLVRCEITGFDAGPDGGDPQLVTDCQPAPQIKTRAPQVNGQAGGNATVGIAVWPDAERAEYRYNAPATVPQPRTVAVSVETLLNGAPGSTTRTTLVSNITIEDDEGCAWAARTPAFDYDVYVSAFSVQAAEGNASYIGTGKLQVAGRMKRITAPVTSVVVFSSYGEPATGLVNVHGTLRVNDPAQPYTQTYAASGAPTGLGNLVPPALFVMSVDTATCTYAFGGGAMTLGSVVGGPGATDTAVMTPGELHFKNMPIAADAGTARRIAVESLTASYLLDTEGNGFAPWTSLLPLPSAGGNTLASWELRAVAP